MTVTCVLLSVGPLGCYTVACMTRPVKSAIFSYLPGLQLFQRFTRQVNVCVCEREYLFTMFRALPHTNKTTKYICERDR